MAEESYTGEAYCVKCKAKREFTGHVEETNGPVREGHLPNVRHQSNAHFGQSLNTAFYLSNSLKGRPSRVAPLNISGSSAERGARFRTG